MNQVLLRDILSACCAYYCVAPSDVLNGRRRAMNLVATRHAFVVLARTLTPCSLPVIGEFMRTSHSTIVTRLHTGLDKLKDSQWMKVDLDTIIHRLLDGRDDADKHWSAFWRRLEVEQARMNPMEVAP